jgi:hypothetical protein
MLSSVEVIKKFLCSFLSFLSLNSLYNRLPDKPGPVDSDLSHPLSQSIVDFDCDCPHWRHYLKAVPKYGLIGITRSLPAIPPPTPFFSRN